jgi:hypothetical protein
MIELIEDQAGTQEIEMNQLFQELEIKVVVDRSHLKQLVHQEVKEQEKDSTMLRKIA